MLPIGRHCGIILFYILCVRNGNTFLLCLKRQVQLPKTYLRYLNIYDIFRCVRFNVLIVLKVHSEHELLCSPVQHNTPHGKLED